MIDKNRDLGDAKKNKHYFGDVATRFLDDPATGQLIRWNEKNFKYTGTHWMEEKNLPTLLRKWMMFHAMPHSNTVIGNVVPFIHTKGFIHENKYPQMPFYVGKEEWPGIDKLITYKNGILNVATKEMKPHTREWVSTFCLPYDYDPSAGCPKWLAFLDEVFEGCSDSIKLLQEWFGYCLLPDTSQHKFLLMAGVPRAGKGVIEHLLRCTVGEEYSCGFNLHKLAERFGPAVLVGKHVALVGEVHLAASREKYRILETFNSIVGGDPIQCEEKCVGRVPSLVLPTRFVIACNEIPNFVDPSGSWAARALILRFVKSFRGKEDRELPNKLRAEISGINNWALDGLDRLKANGKFSESAMQKEMVNEVERANSHWFAYMQDRLVVQKAFASTEYDGVKIIDKPLSIVATTLANDYVTWGVETGRLVNTGQVGQGMNTRLPKCRKSQPRDKVTGNQIWTWLGVDLKKNHE